MIDACTFEWQKPINGNNPTNAPKGHSAQIKQRKDLPAPMQAFEFENIISTTHAWVCLLFLLGANISTLTGQGLRAAWCLFPSCIDAKYLRALTPRRGGGVQVTPTSPRLNACRRVAVTLVGSCFLYAQNLNPGAKHVRHKLERSQARARSQSRRPAQAPSPDQHNKKEERKEETKGKK